MNYKVGDSVIIVEYSRDSLYYVGKIDEIKALVNCQTNNIAEYRIYFQNPYVTYVLKSEILPYTGIVKDLYDV